MEVQKVNTQLIDACTERPHQSIDKIRNLVESCCPDAVKVRSHIRLLDEERDEMGYRGSTKFEGYPLHFASMNDSVSLQVVEYLVEQFPDAVKTTTADGRLPLHLVCKSEAVSLALVQYLVEQWPDAVKMADQAGNLPLHLVSLNKSASSEIVQYLVKQWPDAVKMADKAGNFALHLVSLNKSASPEIVQYLVKQWPDAVKMADKAGDLPLHLCLSKGAPSLKSVQCLVKQWPDAIRVTGAMRRLPLDAACWRHDGTVSLEVVQFLVELWPDAVKSVRPGEGNCLPLHASIRNTNPSLDVVQFLVEQWPDAVKVVSWDTCICGDHQLRPREYSYLGERLKLIMAATEPTWTPMEAMFRPTNSRQVPSYRPTNSRPVNAVELMPNLTTDDILATGITWEAFCYFLHVVESAWLTETTCIYLASRYTSSSSWCFSIGHPEHATVKVGFSPNSLGLAVVAAIEFVLRLLPNSEQVVRIEFCNDDIQCPLPITGPALSRFFEQSDAQRVELTGLILLEAQCHVLMTAPRSNMEVQLQYCILLDEPGCRDAFIQCLQSDGGPMELDRCQIDCQTLADALAGNSRVVKANLCLDTGMAALFSLAENRGLKELRMDDPPIDDEDWLTMCEALQTHPTLASLYLGYISNSHVLSAERRKTRTRAIANMLQTNTIIRTIDIVDDEYDEDQWDLEMYDDLIMPRLATNIFRHRLVTVQETTIDPFRKRLLGRVLQSKSVRSDSNRVWMLLSKNVNIVLDAANVANLNI
jgi:hypothetical protein